MSKSQLDIGASSDFRQQRADRDVTLSEIVPAICADSFPDNKDNIWHIERTAHSDDTAFVLVRPEPNDVGYDLFVLLVDFSLAEKPITAQAIYAQEAASGFSILATEPDCPEIYRRR
jgi:hypothetical protein